MRSIDGVVQCSSGLEMCRSVGFWQREGSCSSKRSAESQGRKNLVDSLIASVLLRLHLVQEFELVRKQAAPDRQAMKLRLRRQVLCLGRRSADEPSHMTVLLVMLCIVWICQ